MSKVQYRDITGFPGYSIGNDGSALLRGRKIPVYAYPNGYLYLALWRTGEGQYTRLVHRLVLEAFVGHCPPGMECCHADGDRTNNHVANLRWDTRVNNHADKRKHGTNRPGSKSPLAKLTEADALEIRERYAAGETQQSIADSKGVDRATIGYVVRRDTWTHI